VPAWGRASLAELVIEGLRVRGCGPFDLRLEAGTCVVLSGASGAGKTLLLRALADLDPHTGRVALDGDDAASLPPSLWRGRVGLLPSESHWWHDVVGDHFPRADVPAAAELAALGLPADALAWRVDRASTGERQRLALLRLLARRPRALLLDEPTANLDAESTGWVEACIARYREGHGACVLWVAHDPAQAARVAARRFVLCDGKLLPSRERLVSG
jgi:ABC-type iron transport system FetAB ATPase subunit